MAKLQKIKLFSLYFSYTFGSMNDAIKYPLFRKYAHEKTYFKVISADEFEELQLLGGKVVVHLFKAKILPDRNYIYDLTFDYETNWVVCSEEEYEKVKSS